MKFIMLICFVLASVGAMLGQTELPTGTMADFPLLQARHVFTISVLSATASQWKNSESSNSMTRSVAVSLHVEQIFRGHLSTGVGASIDVTVKQIRYGAGIVWDNPELWSYIDLNQGQEYLIVSNKAIDDAARIFQSPDRVEQIAGTTAAQDLEFLFRNVALPIGQQAVQLSVWLQRTNVPHGWHIGKYAGWLLSQTSLREIGLLREFISKEGEKVLTKDGEHAMLVELFQQSHGKQQQNDEVIKVLAIGTMQLLTPRQQRSDKPDKLQLDIIENYLPWLLSSQQARTLLKTDVLSPNDKIHALAGLDALSKSANISPQNRDILKILSDLLQHN